MIDRGVQASFRALRGGVLAACVAITSLAMGCADHATEPSSSVSQGESTGSGQGAWGRVTPIADGQHPNLFYDQSEVDELRNMILVQQGPSSLVSLYNNVIRNAVAEPNSYDQYSEANMKAAINYMIEPSSAKANAIRAALLSYEEAFPGGLYDWYTTGGCHNCGYYAPFMFDLLLAYNPEVLSADEQAGLKDWFRLSSNRLRIDSRDQCLISGPGTDCSTWVAPITAREGKRMSDFPNWYSRYMGPALAAALVSGDQAAVDYWADSGWPHDLLTYEGVTSTYPPDTANRFDLVTYLLAVYPSGANTDSYTREGFNIENHTWNTTTYAPGADGGAYHFAQMSGVMMGAEMAYHNGMKGVFGITDTGSEPALFRTFKRAVATRYEPDLRADSKTGHPFLWHDPQNMLGYRRYADPELESVIPEIYSECGMQCGPEMPDWQVWSFFGYPRRVVWTSGEGAGSSSGGSSSGGSSSGGSSSGGSSSGGSSSGGGPTCFGYTCSGAAVTAVPGDVVCGDDFMNWTCTASNWAPLNTSCSCE